MVVTKGRSRAIPPLFPAASLGEMLGEMGLIEIASKTISSQQALLIGQSVSAGIVTDASQFAKRIFA